jgi:hypothetical protein
VTSGRVNPLFRVILCFSSYFEVHAALRSLVVLGKDDHEESQIPDLWLESDLLPAISALTVGTNPTALFPAKLTPTQVTVVSVVPPLTTLPPAPARPLLARSLLPWLSDA